MPLFRRSRLLSKRGESSSGCYEAPELVTHLVSMIPGAPMTTVGWHLETLGAWRHGGEEFDLMSRPPPAARLRGRFSAVYAPAAVTSIGQVPWFLPLQFYGHCSCIQTSEGSGRCVR